MDNKIIEKRVDFFINVSNQVDHALARHGSTPWGRHEFYGILKEEVDELWEAIKTDQPVLKLYDELLHVAAVCARYAETGIERKEWLTK